MYLTLPGFNLRFYFSALAVLSSQLLSVRQLPLLTGMDKDVVGILLVLSCLELSGSSLIPCTTHAVLQEFRFGYRTAVLTPINRFTDSFDNVASSVFTIMNELRANENPICSNRRGIRRGDGRAGGGRVGAQERARDAVVVGVVFPQDRG